PARGGGGAAHEPHRAPPPARAVLRRLGDPALRAGRLLRGRRDLRAGRLGVPGAAARRLPRGAVARDPPGPHRSARPAHDRAGDRCGGRRRAEAARGRACAEAALTAPVLTLLGKPDCGLCREMRATVERVLPAFGASLVERDVRDDPETERRYLLE